MVQTNYLYDTDDQGEAYHNYGFNDSRVGFFVFKGFRGRGWEEQEGDC